MARMNSSVAVHFQRLVFCILSLVLRMQNYTTNPKQWSMNKSFCWLYGGSFAMKTEHSLLFLCSLYDLSFSTE